MNDGEDDNGEDLKAICHGAVGSNLCLLAVSVVYS